MPKCNVLGPLQYYIRCFFDDSQLDRNMPNLNNKRTGDQNKLHFLCVLHSLFGAHAKKIH